MSLVWPLVTQCIRSARRVAVIDDQGETTYGKLLGGACFVAREIEAATRYDKVGLLLPTSAAVPMSLLATWITGRAVVPLNYLLDADDLRHVIRDSGVDAILTADKLLDFLVNAQGANPDTEHEPDDPRPAGVPADVKLLRLDRLKPRFKGIPPLRWPPTPEPDDLACLLYTSGTSGKPKGVMLTHRNLQANVAQIRRHVHATHHEVFLGVLPQFHSFGLTALTLLPLSLGARVIYTARFMPKKLVALMREHKPSIFVAIPSMYTALAAVKDATPEDWAPVRLPISGGEPLPQATYERFQKEFRVTIYEGYGLTETSPVTHVNLPDAHRRGTVGRPLPDVRHFIAAQHNPDDQHPSQNAGQNSDQNHRADPPALELLGPNVDGEVLLAGPNIMRGYYGLPDLTEEVIVKLNAPTPGHPSSDPTCDPNADQLADTAPTVRAFRTGDIGHVTDDGFLAITGRKKEMLIIAGENVFPREVEEELDRHELVNASAVVGVSDDVRGEVPIAYVELVESDDGNRLDASKFDEAATRAWLRERIAPFKVPREIRVIDALPRNPTGKIMRRKLKEQA